jgi:hypothetical protein
VLGLALPAAAVAQPSAQNQYTPPNVSAGGSGHGRGNPSGTVSPGGGGSGSAVLPIVLGGVVVIGGAGAIILYRRRQSDPTSPE